MAEERTGLNVLGHSLIHSLALSLTPDPMSHMYHLQKEYKSTCHKRQFMHCLSYGYNHKLLRYQVFLLLCLHYRLCMPRYRSVYKVEG